MRNSNAANQNLQHLAAACRARRNVSAARIDLSSEPRLRVVAPPEIEPCDTVGLASARALLDAVPGRFDGDIMIFRGWNEDQELEVFPATYAWLFCITLARHGSPLCVGIDITNSLDERLVQWPDPVMVAGEGPRIAVGGYVGALEQPRDAALREANEELGLRGDDLAQMQPALLTLDRSGALIVYRAEISASHALAPGAEVARVSWVDDSRSREILPDDQTALIP